MAASELGILGIARIQEIFDAVQDQRQVPQNLVFRSRVNKVNATDADLIARFLQQVHIADIVADDQKASTYAAGRIKFESNLIPNLKLGQTWLQEDIKRMEFLTRNRPENVESLSYEEYFQGQAEGLMLGLEMREESFLVGLEIDTFTYNRNGIILTINWGMPAELKLTSTVAWTDATNSTPVTDITNQRLIAATKYGKVYNRIKMSTPALNLMTRSAEFRAQVQSFFINTGQPLPQIPLQSPETLQNLVGKVLNMTVELYDARYPSHPTTGAAPTYVPFLPLNKVILDSTDNDRNNAAKDLGNGIVTESVVGQIGPNNLLGQFRPQFGPFTFFAPTVDLNPPNGTWWAVERSLPRKKQEALTSVIDIGTVVDLISPGVAF
jgi:Phage major capsid protein E